MVNPKSWVAHLFIYYNLYRKTGKYFYLEKIKFVEKPGFWCVFIGSNPVGTATFPTILGCFKINGLRYFYFVTNLAGYILLITTGKLCKATFFVP